MKYGANFTEMIGIGGFVMHERSLFFLHEIWGFERINSCQKNGVHEKFEELTNNIFGGQEGTQSNPLIILPREGGPSDQHPDLDGCD